MQVYKDLEWDARSVKAVTHLWSQRHPLSQQPFLPLRRPVWCAIYKMASLKENASTSQPNANKGDALEILCAPSIFKRKSPVFLDQ